MGSRRGLVKQFCHAALGRWLMQCLFAISGAGCSREFALRMWVVLSFDFAKAARGPA